MAMRPSEASSTAFAQGVMPFEAGEIPSGIQCDRPECNLLRLSGHGQGKCNHRAKRDTKCFHDILPWAHVSWPSGMMDIKHSSIVKR